MKSLYDHKFPRIGNFVLGTKWEFWNELYIILEGFNHISIILKYGKPLQSCCDCVKFVS
jgi:hypothetical protein